MQHILSFLLVFISLSAFTQTQLTGQVVDKITGEKLAYVNIGVVGKNIGTVSDRDGKFTLSVPSANYGDPLRISIIAYNPIEMDVKEFDTMLRRSRTVRLTPSNYEIDEVLIESTSLLSKKVGNTRYNKNIRAGFGEEILGNEMGILIKIKKRPTIIKDINFYIGCENIDTVRFRVNVYSMKRGKPFKNLLKDNIVIETSISAGIVTTDLSKYNIQVEDDFLLTLEWIENYPEKSIYFGSSLFSKPIWVRETSQAKFTKVPIIGIGLFATILY